MTTPRATEYMVVHNSQLDRLIYTVNQQLERGWRVSGSIAVDQNGFYQPMVK